MRSSSATEAQVRRLLTAAGQAPSVHNTQPWRFDVLHGELLSLSADLDRRLPVSDPRGRSMHVSCGAALLNLRLAARTAGARPALRLLPESEDDPYLLAVVHLAKREPAGRRTRELYDLIPLRHTCREPFDERRLPSEVMAALRTAASREGATLIFLGRHAAAQTLEQVAIAEEELAADLDYRAELAAWTMRRARYDGVPLASHGPRPLTDPPPIRDYGAHDHSMAFEARPQLAVLTTPGNRPLDWLVAGQALQRTLLTAARYGVSASFLNQPLDLRDMRRRTDPHHRRGHPQMIIRLGYGPQVTATPRRPVGDLRLPT
ncbi:nitroreductase family protein [Spongiactinospora sp. TRM90649]|nr:nitroreductase family protein [Spongiactinospora sp. TRM90649]MDF5755205.1 nitroreductase family protein [Spongiactinospora sp. TRM90649]